MAAAATAKFDKVNLNAESEPSSIIELKPVTEIGTKKLPGLGSALPKNCFVSLYVNGKRCLLTMDAQCLVYEPELSSSCSNGKLAPTLLDLAFFVYASTLNKQTFTHSFTYF